MRTSGQIIGAPVVSISDGVQLGQVSDLIISVKGDLDFFVIEPEQIAAEDDVIALPFAEVIGLGDYAVTVQERGAFINLAKLSFGIELMKRKANMVDCRIITSQGTLLGQLTEYLIDEVEGKIDSVLFTPTNQGGELQIPRKQIVSFGQQVLIVSGEKVQQKDTKKRTKQTEPPAEELVPDHVPIESGGGKSVDLFIERQRQFVLGKRLTKDVVTDSGQVLAQAEEEVTEEVFQRVFAAGRKKIIELTMLAK